MAGEQRLTATLQENLITLLAHDDVAGKIVCNMLETNLMEGEYRLLAEKMIDYWRQYDRPPRDHVADLVEEIISDTKNRRSKPLKRIIGAMIELAESVNADYVMDQLRMFSRMQRFKGAIIDAADKINNQGQTSLPEVEELFNTLLREEQKDFDPGFRLNNVDAVLDRMDLLTNEFTTGIHELDENGVVPMRGTLFMLIAAAGRGKTWGLIQIGKRALMDRKKVLHITLEMDEEPVAQRYYQALFNIPKRKTPVHITTIEQDLGDFTGFGRHEYTPAFTFQSTTIRDDLSLTIKKFSGTKLNNLLIKRFPPDYLTPSNLRAYLDNLEATEGFIPDMIIVDYLGEMKITNPKDYTRSLGSNCTALRGIGVERNVAMVSAHQGSKIGEEASLMKTTHIAGDWSIVGTADTIVTYSTTDPEFAMGLGRVYVGKCRSERDRYITLITQSYTTGQFSMDSFPMFGTYSEAIKDLTGHHSRNPETADDEDDDEDE